MNIIILFLYTHILETTWHLQTHTKSRPNRLTQADIATIYVT